MEFFILPDINSKMIGDLIAEHKACKLPRYNRFMRYYKGKHDILDRTVRKNRTNNKIMDDYPGYITDVINGYFIGVPLKYSSSNKNFIPELNEIFDANNEEEHNAKLAKFSGIFGESFELLYMDEEANIRFKRLKNDETFVVYKDNDDEASLQLGLRYYDIINKSDNNKVITKVEVYDEEKISFYTQDGASYKLDYEMPHYFGKVPIVYYPNNDERMGDFEKQLTLIDDYNKRISDNSNELEDFRNAYLKLKNLSGTTKDDLDLMKKMGAMMVGENGDASWLERNINDAFTEHHLQRLNANIHKFAKVPDLSDEAFAGNLSGVAIRFKLWPLEQIAKIKERKFKSGIKRRIKLINNILTIKGNLFDERDISIKFTRNIPDNILEAAQVASELNGIVSQETLLNTIPFVDSAADEIIKIQKEQEDNLNY